MTRYIVLLRGINVVGANTLPMTELAALLGALGCADVRTYIQSGNAILRSDLPRARLASAIQSEIAAGYGFTPRVLLLTRAELERAVAANPFPEVTGDPRTLHLFFLMERARRPDLDGMRSLAVNGERFALDGKVYYLHTPGGFGPSKLAGRVERLLGVQATARNWRTTTTLLSMAKS